MQSSASSHKPPVADLTQLSAFIQVRGRALTYLAKFTDREVKRHEITTNGGKKRRTIYAPSEALKMAQTRLRENILMTLPLPSHVHGFVPGRSLVSNASAHVDSGLIVNIDLKDFFPSISARRVYGFWRWVFEGARNEKEQARLAWVCTGVTTHENHLCQGFVTSPDIANHVAWKLDIRLHALATSKGLRYTRYADDLTFSTKAYDGNCRWLIEAVREIVDSEGFKVNPKKIAIMRPHRRQVVTGLVVNRVYSTVEEAIVDAPPRIPRRELRRIRAMCDKGKNTRSPEDHGHVDGWLAYINSVNPQKAEQLRALREARIASPKPPKATEHG